MPRGATMDSLAHQLKDGSKRLLRSFTARTRRGNQLRTAALSVLWAVVLLWTKPELLAERTHSIVVSARHGVLSTVGFTGRTDQSWGKVAAVDGAATVEESWANGPTRRIMQTWKDVHGDHGSEWLGKNAITTATEGAAALAAPSWRYDFLTDADAMKFLRSVDPTQADADRFSTIRPGAIKADFLRLEWLYTYGGFYIDQDLTPVALEKYTRMADVVLVKSSDDAKNCTSEIYNAFMYVRHPRSPLIKQMLSAARRRIDNRYVDRAAGVQCCYAVAGPMVVADILQESMSSYCQLETNSCRNRFNHRRACNIQINTQHTTDTGETVILLLEGDDEVTTRKYDPPDGVMHAYGGPCGEEARVPPWAMSRVYRVQWAFVVLWWANFAVWVRLSLMLYRQWSRGVAR